MWCIKGSDYPDYGNISHSGNEYIVCIFTFEIFAQRYLKQSRLKNPTNRKAFKQSSLLRNCKYAHIEKYTAEEYIVNPEL